MATSKSLVTHFLQNVFFCVQQKIEKVFGIINVFGLMKLAVWFYSTTISFISKDQRKCDFSIHDPLKIINHHYVLLTLKADKLI